MVPATRRLAAAGSCGLTTPLILLHIFSMLAPFTKR
jgi:hypothetical protein